MNWEAIGVIAEVVGAVAVIISLVYLAVQVKSNTRALKASSSFDTTHSWATLNEVIVSSIVGEAEFQKGEESRFVEVTAKFYSSEARPGEMTSTELVLMALIHRALFQKLEGQYYHFKHGYVEPQIWITRRNWARGLLALPMVREWWDEEVRMSIYSPEFVSIISGAPIEGIDVRPAALGQTG